MKPSAVKAVSVRLAASLGLVALAAAPALAGDAANFAALGFSADGRYFGYEEFGVQDGSGFPYSSIFILDVAEDKWAGGSPFRVRLEEESLGLAGVRGEAMEQAAKAFADLGISEPAVIEALNGDGEVGHDGASIEFGARGFGMDPPSNPVTLNIETFESTSTVPCVDSFGFPPPVGFALTLEAGGESTELHRDTSVPASRNCTVAYRPYGIVAPVNWSWNQLTPVAIISVFSQGFEGPDRRFIAVPIPGVK
jgi:predicted secreted protein